MAKYENIRALAKKQLQAVTESSDRWKAFLRTAAIPFARSKIWIAVDLTVPVTTLTYKRIPAYWTVL